MNDRQDVVTGYRERIAFSRSRLDPISGDQVELRILRERVAELEGDPRLAFDGDDYCNLRNLISECHEGWATIDAALGDYLDELDEKVRQALIAHRAALAVEKGEGT